MIDSIDDLISDSERTLDGVITRSYQASAVAMNLFLLSYVYGLENEMRVTKLRERLDNAVRNAELEVLSDQVGYATRLAEAPGQLEYEELHKLLALLDEIYALRQIGFSMDPSRSENVEEAARARFAKQHRAARLAAQDRVEDWNRALWWYAELLGTDS